MGSIYDWDLISSNNESSDELINWVEGQRPSSTNDSARAMMKRIREYLSDTGGSLQGAVVNHDYTKTTRITIRTNTSYKKYIDDLFIRFQASNKNIGETSLSIDDLPDRPIIKTSELGNVLLTGGEIQHNCIYEIVYRDVSLSGAQGYWFLLNPTPVAPPLPPKEQILPSGTIAAFAMQALPRGWLVCDGRAVSRSTYKELLDAIGLTWGIGDGVNTFNLPDLRGMFLRGFDAGRGIDRNRAFGDKQDQSFKIHSVSGDTGKAVYDSTRSKRSLEDELTPQSIVWVVDGAKHANISQRVRRDAFDDVSEDEKMEMISELRRLMQHEHSFVSHWVGGSETRPVNMSIVYGIKT